MVSLLLAAALQVADMAKIVDLEEPALSADGKRVAVLAISQDMAKAAYSDRLMLVDVATGRSTALPPLAEVGVPRWAPQGTRLVYLARTAEGATRQVFVRAESGATLQLTHAKGDVVDAVWSPDGRTIAYVATDPQKPATFFYAGDNDYTATALTPPCHVWVVPAAGGAERRLTERVVDGGAHRSRRHLLAADRVDARRASHRVHARGEHVQRQRRTLDDLAG